MIVASALGGNGGCHDLDCALDTTEGSWLAHGSKREFAMERWWRLMKSMHCFARTVVHRVENGEALTCGERQISRGVASVRWPTTIDMELT